MGKHYDQPATSVTDQIALLKSGLLQITDEQRAAHLLNNISFFRLKSYMYPLMADKQLRIFKPGATFEKVYNLYKFDSALRKLLSAELEKIEVSIRTQISAILCREKGVFWFADVANFSNERKHADTLKKIKAELDRSDDDQILAFKQEYDDEFPPAWMTLEVTSLGSLSMLYSLLKPGQEKREIARYYGLPDTVFESWLHSIVYVRNICAHHSRLWNKVLRICPQPPRRTHRPFLTISARNNRVYYVLSVIQYLLQTINPTNTFSERLQSLLAQYPEIDTSAMGFPANWQSEPIWTVL